MKTSVTLQPNSSSYSPSKLKVHNMYNILEFTPEMIKQHHITVQGCLLKNEETDTEFKISSEPHSWPFVMSLLCTLFKPPVTFFNTIPALQVYQNSLPIALTSKQPALVERTEVLWSEDLGVNPDPPWSYMTSWPWANIQFSEPKFPHV